MQTKVNGTKYEFYVEGSIGETNALFTYPLKAPTEVLVDMDKVTVINSIGVKNWINWCAKIAPEVKFELQKCPFVIMSQVNMVAGFLPPHARVNSFYALYSCGCRTEEKVLFERGKHFKYEENGVPSSYNFPSEAPCKKCGKMMEADFFPEKLSKFLVPPEKPKA